MNLHFRKEYCANDAILLVMEALNSVKQNWVHTPEGDFFKMIYVKQLINLVKSRIHEVPENMVLIKVLTIGDIIGIMSSLKLTDKLTLPIATQEIILDTICLIVNKLDRSAEVTNRISSIIEKEIHTLN